MYQTLSLKLMVPCLLVVACSSSDPTPVPTAPTLLNIGTGSVSGVYYPAGCAVANLINLYLAEAGYRASPTSTRGSVFNINAVANGELQFGLAQSDRQFQAVRGLKEWAGKPVSSLRAICSLHPEIVTLIAARDAGIDSVAALKGKRVNIGNLGSGQRGNAEDVLAAFGLDPQRDLQADSLKAIEAPGMLEDQRIDAFFYTVGHPNSSIKDCITGQRAVDIIPIVGPPVEALIADKPYYSTALIPVQHYPQAAHDQDIPSLGVSATLITTNELDEALVYAVTKVLFEHLDELRTMHPALETLQADQMLRGLTAPLHAGARRYYLEQGLPLPASE